MSHPSKTFSRRALAATVASAMLLVFSGVSNAQVPIYNATILPANTQTGAVHFLESVTLGQGPGTYTLTSFQLGLNFNTGLVDQGIHVVFYTNLDLSAGSANALANAVQISVLSDTLPAPGRAGDFTFTITLGAPISLPSNVLGVEFTLQNSSLEGYSTEMNGRFSAVAPTLGSSPGFVWNDANLDGTFTGAEQTNFGQTGAYVRFSMTGTTPVPEPSTWAILIGGLAAAAFSMRRRLA